MSNVSAAIKINHSQFDADVNQFVEHGSRTPPEVKKRILNSIRQSAEFQAAAHTNIEAGRLSDTPGRVFQFGGREWLITHDDATAVAMGTGITFSIQGSDDGPLSPMQFNVIEAARNNVQLIEPQYFVWLIDSFGMHARDNYIAMLDGMFNHISDRDVVTAVEYVMAKFDHVVDVLPETGQISLTEYIVYLRMMVNNNYAFRDNTTRQVSIPRYVMKYERDGRLYIRVKGTARVRMGDRIAIVDSMINVQVPSAFDVNDLPFSVVPLEQTAVIAKEQERAFKSRTTLNGASHAEYNGIAYVPGMFGGRVRLHLDSRVVIDAPGCHSIAPGQMNALLNLYDITVSYDDDDEIITMSADDMTEREWASMYQVDIMFDLGRNIWAIGDSKHATPVTYRTQAFDQLVLKPEFKELIQALVTVRQDDAVDFINSKGGGAIFLMNGPPGTGKTLTAEASAETLKRILYKVSLGDLLSGGMDDLEGRLNETLLVADRWNAILLIDEADVFLEKRTSDNIERNAMVAVFLRLLEYYQGVLFLTTNRGHNIDDAFQSRINVALNYDHPTADVSRQIWTGLLTLSDIEVTEAEMAQLIGYNVNGRVIKNSINSAQSVAKFRGEQVGINHITQVLECQASFDKSLTTD